MIKCTTVIPLVMNVCFWPNLPRNLYNILGYNSEKLLHLLIQGLKSIYIQDMILAKSLIKAIIQLHTIPNQIKWNRGSHKEPVNKLFFFFISKTNYLHKSNTFVFVQTATLTFKDFSLHHKAAPHWFIQKTMLESFIFPGQALGHKYGKRQGY